jgi:hypothetical protein
MFFELSATGCTFGNRSMTVVSDVGHVKICYRCDPSALEANGETSLISFDTNVDAFVLTSGLLRIPVRICRPPAAREALGLSPPLQTSRADPSRIEGVPLMTAGAKPGVFLPRRPAAERTSNTRTDQRSFSPSSSRSRTENFEVISGEFSMTAIDDAAWLHKSPFSKLSHA